MLAGINMWREVLTKHVDVRASDISSEVTARAWSRLADARNTSWLVLSALNIDSSIHNDERCAIM